jgi:1-acyl-sn-glycerol-3-phosphate acyltransferase
MTYRICRALMRLFFRLVGDWQVEGRENVPPEGALILAPNHVGFLDPPLVGCALDRPAWFMAKAELFRLVPIRRFLTALHAFPVQRGTGDRAALKRALDHLAAGRAVTLFPEGTRSQTGELGEPELGIGMIALRSGAAIVPMAIVGTDRVMPRGAKWIRTGTIRLRIGKPLRFPAPEGKPGREEYAAVARRVMEEIRALREGMA